MTSVGKIIGKPARLLVVASVLLVGCGNYTEQKSPCVCNFESINDPEQKEAFA